MSYVQVNAMALQLSDCLLLSVVQTKQKKADHTRCLQQGRSSNHSIYQKGSSRLVHSEVSCLLLVLNICQYLGNVCQQGSCVHCRRLHSLLKSPTRL